MPPFGFYIFIFYISMISATFSLWLNEQTMKRILGLEGIMPFVSGTHIFLSVGANLEISSDVDKVYLTWQSLTLRQIPYKIDFQAFHENIPYELQANVSSSGFIPMAEQTFFIEINCLGNADKNMPVLLHFNVTDPSFGNATELKFSWTKICADPRAKVTIRPNTKDSEDSQLKALYTALCFSISLIIIFLICSSAIIVSRRRKEKCENVSQVEERSNLREEEKGMARPLEHPAPYLLNPLTIVNSGTSTSSNVSHCSVRNRKVLPPDNNQALDLHERISEITIRRAAFYVCLPTIKFLDSSKRVKLLKIELEGTFGKVYDSLYAKEDGTEVEVVVKTVMDFASPTQISLLLREGLLMYGLKHKNIMSVLGVSIDDQAEPFVIYLKEDYRNMKRFLQKCKLSAEGVAHTLTTQEVVQLALQIISGMQYMHKKKLLHKDLATRNCLIDSSLNVKVSDSALSRDLFPNDYHCLGDNENRPIKWLALESLVHRTFTTASDVWMFGVTLWELMTLAQQPYVDIDPFEVEHYLKDGYRLPQPVNCPDELFAVMAYCWATNGEKRPAFSQLLVCLQDLHAQLSKYV